MIDAELFIRYFVAFCLCYMVLKVFWMKVLEEFKR